MAAKENEIGLWFQAVGVGASGALSVSFAASGLSSPPSACWRFLHQFLPKPEAISARSIKHLSAFENETETKLLTCLFSCLKKLGFVQLAQIGIASNSLIAVKEACCCQTGRASSQEDSSKKLSLATLAADWFARI